MTSERPTTNSNLPLPQLFLVSCAGETHTSPRPLKLHQGPTARPPVGLMRCQLSSESVIVANYNLHVFTRSSCAPACSPNFSTHVEASTPPRRAKERNTEVYHKSCKVCKNRRLVKTFSVFLLINPTPQSGSILISVIFSLGILKGARVPLRKVVESAT